MGTPLAISNREVKHIFADGTTHDMWESRKLPLETILTFRFPVILKSPQDVKIEKKKF